VLRSINESNKCLSVCAVCRVLRVQDRRDSWLHFVPLLVFMRANRGHTFQTSVLPLIPTIIDFCQPTSDMHIGVALTPNIPEIEHVASARMSAFLTTAFAISHLSHPSHPPSNSSTSSIA